VGHERHSPGAASFCQLCDCFFVTPNVRLSARSAIQIRSPFGATGHLESLGVTTISFGVSSFSRRMAPLRSRGRKPMHYGISDKPLVQVLDELGRTEQHVREARQIVERQRQIVAKLKAADHDAHGAEHTLKVFIGALDALEKHVLLLRREAGIDGH
jgi:hypothetical protein